MNFRKSVKSDINDRKNQFKYCGIIYLENNEKRVAFEKNYNN